MPRPRPTIRCLHDDLAGGLSEHFSDVSQRQLLRQRQLPPLSLPLDQIAHPLITTTAEKHETDQRWLCFGGWHEAGSPDDAYEKFRAACTVAGGVDSSGYLPTQKDWTRLEGEKRLAVKQAENHAFRVAVIHALLAAVANVDEPQATILPDGTELRVVVSSEADDTFDELRLRFTINWKGGRGYAQTDDVKAAIPGIALGEWEDLPPGPDSDPLFVVYLEVEWFPRLVTAAREHGVEALGTNPNLVLDPSDGLAHVGTSGAVTAGYVNGAPLRSLCGRRFVPSVDPQGVDACESCMFIAGVIELAQARRSEST